MKKLLGVALLAVAVLAQGCARNIFTMPVQENAAALAHFAKPAAAYNPAHYPLTITNINSKGESEEATYTKPPERVVAVWQNSIETLLALGVGDRIIAGNGVPDKSYFLPQYQKQYGQIPYTGLQLLDLETTMMLQPDLIVGWHSTFGAKVLRGTDFWHKRGVNTYIANNSSPRRRYKTLADEYDDILKLGRIFDKSERAAAIVGAMRREIDFATKRTAHYKTKPRALVIEFLGKDINVYNERTLAGDIVNNLHGDLLGAKDLNIGIEQIVDYDPDVIFVIVIEAYYGREQDMVNRLTQHSALKNLRCVQNKRVVALPLYAVYSAGVRAYDGIKIIARGLYPELYKE